MATAITWSTRLRRNLIRMLLLLAYASSDGAQAEETLPHFDYSRQGSYLLQTSRPWVPGRTTTVTFGRADEPMQIHLGSISGGEDSLYSKSKSCHLMFKCSSEDSEFQQIDLVNRSVSQHWYNTDRLCEGKDRRKFKLQKVNNSVHALTLLKATNISFEQSLKHLMEFRVRVEFSANSVNSSSLFIYSIESVLNMNSVPITSGSHSYRRFFLTDDAIKFMTGRTTLTAEPLMRVNFLEKWFVDLVLSAPPIIGNYLAVTVNISVVGKCNVSNCGPYNTVTLSTGNLDRHQNPGEYNPKGTDIDFHTGAIHVGSQFYAAMNSLRNNIVRVTLAVSMNRLIPLSGTAYIATETVMEFSHTMEYKLSNYSNNCISVGNGTAEWLTLFNDHDVNVALDCPFVCSEKRADCTVYRDEKVCKQWINNTELSGRFDSCSGTGTVAHDGSTAMFPIDFHESLSVTYKFTMLEFNYTYLFNVFEMPLFSGLTSRGGSLPPVTYANLDMSVSFTCTVGNSPLDILMSAYMHVLDSSRLKWHEMTLDKFAIDILRQSPRAIIEKRIENKHEHILLVILPHVTELWKSHEFAFVCRAQVSARDAKQMLGLPHYETESRTQLLFFGRRLPLRNGGFRAAPMPKVLLSLLLLLAATVRQW